MIGDLDPGVLWELAVGRHDTYLRQADSDRVAKRLHRSGLPLHVRATVAIGDYLIVLGVRLKGRYAPRLGSDQLYGASAP